MINNKFSMGAGVVLGALITSGLFSLMSDTAVNVADAAQEEKPLYWVAPMDPNYQRDKPGKSPMGMDLIPFYDNKAAGVDAGPGSISISPDVVNNLGVRTALVESKVLQTEIKTVGYVKYDEDQLLHIHPRVQGWIDKLYVKAAGDPVKKGQALYEIYSPALVNAQEELVLALERNNKRLVSAAEDRLKALQIPSKAISMLKKNRKVQQNVTFYSPQTGVVDNLNIRQGFYVKPGTSLMSIGALNQVWVEAEVFEEQAASVVEGLSVNMSLDYLPGKVWQGRVDYVYPTLDVKTRTLKVRLRFDNANRELKPNMFAQVTIHTKSTGETLLIPKEAVIRTGSMDRAVLVLGEGRYKSVEVKLGRTSEYFAEILMGLKEGERIVTSAQFLLDSESSKTSDFKRMNHTKDDAAITLDAVWTEAKINSVMLDHRMINVSHQPIPNWDWPAMTMDFVVASEVDMSLFDANAKMEILIQKNITGDYSVVDLRAVGSVSENPDNSGKVEGIINSVMAGHRMLNIARGPIKKWNRPAATLNFLVDENIDMSVLEETMLLEFSFNVVDGDFVINEIMSSTMTASNNRSSNND
jgi:membrane fusion protein, copper/silver efflux system